MGAALPLPQAEVPPEKNDQSRNNVAGDPSSSKPVDSSQVQPADVANTPDSRSSSKLTDLVPAEDENVHENEGGTTKDAEQESEGECGFCLFMKGGECKESFIAWEKCVEEAEKGKEDLAQKCFEVTGLLRQCMEANSGYYGPVLQAEKSMEEEAAKAMEEEAAVVRELAASDENVDGSSKDDQSSNNVTENITSSSQVQPAANISDSPSSAEELINVVSAEDENKGGTTEDAEQEEEGECGFCLFMKGGECKESFIAWEKCVEEAETSKEDLAQKCFDVTGLLRQCMEANSDYYAPILKVEKSLEEGAASEHEQAAEEKPSSEAAEERSNTE